MDNTNRNRILPRSFYQQDGLQLARTLLGKVLLRRVGDQLTAGRIVETEAYLGEQDPAAHSYKGNTQRTRIQFGPGGYAYVYLIYGMHCCMNIVAAPEGVPHVVLLRALEPVVGLDWMEQRRHTHRTANLCSGPGKLCQAMAMTGPAMGWTFWGKSFGWRTPPPYRKAGGGEQAHPH